jgi:hypothetical protein
MRDERWRNELAKALIALTLQELKPYPGRLRFIAEIFLTLREIMLLDDRKDTFSKEALNLIKNWLEKADFDLLKELKDFKEIVEWHRRNKKCNRNQ